MQPGLERAVISHKARQFTESVIREMTRLAMRYEAVNMAQGFPDFAAPRELKEAAKRAIDADINQYAITWGARSMREAVAAKARRFLGMGGLESRGQKTKEAQNEAPRINEKRLATGCSIRTTGAASVFLPSRRVR